MACREPGPEPEPEPEPRRPDSSIDVDSIAPEPIMDDEDEYDSARTAAGEATHLLQPPHSTDLPPGVAPDKAFRRMVVAMGVLCLFVVEVSVFIMEPPTQQIMEDIICRDRYPDHALRVPGVEDARCKSYDVQKTLAMVRSWSISAEMVVPLVVQVPYGIVADKYGRRTVLFLSLFGYVLRTAWIMIVLFFPNVFSIWAVLYGSIAYLVGGGGQMTSAMVWTILADAVPVAERTAVFYQLHALTLILAVLVNPLAALLLSIDPWIAMWLGFGILVVGTLSSLLVPETLRLRQMADSRRRRSVGGGVDDDGDDFVVRAKRGKMQQAWFAVKNDMSHIWRFVFASKSIMMLVVAYGLFFTLRLNFSLNMLQYMTKRFSWKWSTATYVSTVSNITSVVALLVILPIASSILVKRLGYDALKRDLLLSRASVALVVLGSFMLAFAAAPWLFVSSLIITSLGAGFSTLCRALLNAVVEPHTVATLNTTISTMETLTGLLGAPALGWLLSRGLDLGGPWLGLPLGCANKSTMSDDEDFMQESDEEQWVARPWLDENNANRSDRYDFEYEEDDDDDSGDVDIENKYYNAKQLKLTDPNDAIAEFLAIPPLEQDKGEWGFKGLKQAIKLEFKQGHFDKVDIPTLSPRCHYLSLTVHPQAADHFAELLTYVKSAVTRNYSEKSINNMLDFIEKGADRPEAVQSMEKFYSLTLQSFQSTNNERLWLKTNIKLAKLLLDRKEYGAVTKKLRELHKACQRPDGSDDPSKGTYSLEIYALEIQMLAETKNNKQLKALYQRALKVKSAVPHPRIMGIIRECGGKMHMSEENWNEAQSDFFESFRNYDEAGSLQRIQVLKYLLLSTMLMKSNINPFDSQETKPYKTDPRISAMTELVDAYQRDDVHGYEKVLQGNQDILADPFIAENIDEVTRNMRTKGVVKLIAPYTRMKLSWIAKQLKISEPEVQDIIGFLIVDGKINGTLNQQEGVLEIASDADAERIVAMRSLTKSISELFGVVFRDGEGFRNVEHAAVDDAPMDGVQGMSQRKALRMQGHQQRARKGKATVLASWAQ
ncbi:COP9 signalosome complex subunit 2 [Tolypocladium paradoxum]|uniref:COP9 signalosome complex subunit 2 n=1 Tax=Tolypocladium paradoxum TaxID=94208 RepID=A0A2S4KZ68_9HYPO|nr:COP9 signalosome complex subunit 2 [Tolypocladium paradoxum]